MKPLIATDIQREMIDILKDAGWEFHTNDGSLVLMKHNISSAFDNFKWEYCSVSHDGKIINIDT